MTTWILSICTAGWVLCGSYIETAYPSEQDCYKALNELYKRQKSEDFKYVICSPNVGAKPK